MKCVPLGTVSKLHLENSNFTRSGDSLPFLIRSELWTYKINMGRIQNCFSDRLSLAYSDFVEFYLKWNNGEANFFWFKHSNSVQTSIQSLYIMKQLGSILWLKIIIPVHTYSYGTEISCKIFIGEALCRVMSGKNHLKILWCVLYINCWMLLVFVCELTALYLILQQQMTPTSRS